MCGILGTVNIEFTTSHLDLIKHRGPDDEGFNRFCVNNNHILFAQRRLSINDLSPSGHQPMLSSCGRYALIFNGEIYNHLELRKSLPDSFVFSGHSDTETILFCLIHHGFDFVKRFNGIFAFAFLDLDNQELFLARDPVGIKPLYYSFSSNELIFSSEIRPFKPLLSELNLELNSLASLLRLRYNPAPDSLFDKIKKVEPGQFLKFQFTSDTIVFSSGYFNFIPKPVIPLSKPLPALINQYGYQLEAAVQRQMLSDVEIGLLLSGGVDSALVSLFAKKHSDKKLKAFTIGFEGENTEDEIEKASITANFIGLEHFTKKINFTDFLGLIEKCTDIVEEPLATTSIIPMYFLSEMAASHVKVVLTGQGADEPLGGYSRYKSEYFRDFIPSPIRKLSSPIVNFLGLKNEQILRSSKSISIKDQFKRFLLTYEIFSKSDIFDLISVDDTLSEVRIRNKCSQIEYRKFKHSVETMMAIDTRMNLSDDLLLYTDKITMNFSMECRVPMLDLEFLHFMESLPIETKLTPRTGKFIHKQFAKSVLPEEIVFQPKLGFQSPTKFWFSTHMDLIKEILLSNTSVFSRTFNLKFVEKVLQQHNNGYNKEKQIFLLLSIYFWLAKNIAV